MARAMPTCPACSRTLGLRHSATFWNPWNFPCPHCKTRLEASRIQKAIAFAVVPLGALLALVPVLLEKEGIWGHRESIVYFAIVIPVVIAAAVASWPRTTFTVRSDR